ncbi:MAG TPA: ABC transporter permease [Candidatus Izemoplasmatales bacterium]|nr:ABC transporter permease [Candidatus Izemoplasmatales bacterium]
MVRYLLKRLLFIVFSILIVITFLYLILHMSMSKFWAFTSFKVGLEMAWDDFVVYAKGIIFDQYFGESMYGQDVWELVWPKFKISMVYNLTSLIVFVPVGIFLGVQATIHKNKLVDVLITIFSMVFNSIPSFLLIFFLVIYVGYTWELLPPIAPYYSAPLGKQLLGLIIPVFALTAGPIGKMAQLVKGELVEIMNSNYFLLLRTKGLTKKRSIYKHGLKEAMVSVIPEIIPTFVTMLGFSFAIELTYNIFGVSKLLLNSMIIRGEMYNSLAIDIPVVVTIGILIYGTIMISAFFTDVALQFIDPRIAIHGNKYGVKK